MSLTLAVMAKVFVVLHFVLSLGQHLGQVPWDAHEEYVNSGVPGKLKPLLGCVNYT